MKKKKRSFLQKMLAVLLSAVLMTGMIITAMASEINTAMRASLPAAKEGHTHKICTGSACTDDNHSDITFEAWTDPVSLPADSGNYYLDTDVTLTYTWYPADGTNLCLNGHTVTQTAGSSSVIEIGKGVTFTLCDCNSACGKLTGGKKSGVYNNGGTFYMYGGEINGNSYSNGGGVYNSSVFSLYGGKISNNKASTYRGGGVYNPSSGTFTMYGGEISNNNASSGVSGAGGGGVATEGTFAMYGGVITGNNSYDSRISGVFFVGGTMKIGGTAVIKDNKSSDTVGNVYFYYSAPPLIIDADNPPTEGAYIGVTLYDEENAFTGTNDADYSKYFHSDSPYSIVVIIDENKLKLEHRHMFTKYEEVPADCSNPGTKEFWVCEGCYRMFRDEEGTQEILDESEIIIPQREHSFVWKYDEENHWKECKYDNCDVKEGDSSPHGYDNSSDMTCDCGYDRSALDKNAPTGTITIGKDTWNTLLNTVNFNLFFKEAVQVTIEAEDTGGSLNSGVDKVYYHISDKSLTEAQIKALDAAYWTEGTSVSINPDKKCVVYAKITDKAGNAAFLSSDGLVLDKTAPAINGVTDGETYNSPQEITVTDENLESVKVNGTETALINGKLSLTANGEYTITALDKAGNVTQITVTITEKQEPSHTHDWKTDTWEQDENYHWHSCKNADCPIAENSGKDGYGKHVYDNSSDMTCNTCDYNRTTLDKDAPTGTITIDTNSWKKFLNTVTFGLFFKETKEAQLTAQDTAGTVISGVDKVYYHISDKALTEAQVEALEATDWAEGTTVSINPDKKCVVYAKITDKAGNAAFLSSDGLIFDGTAPAINGVTDGETYSSPQEVTVTDENLESVKVGGTETVLVNGKLSLTTDGEYTITAVDKAGNTTSVTITIAIKTHTHDYGTEWKSDKTNHWHECECGEKKDSAAHTEDSGTVTKSPTETETGIKTFKCSICSYVMRTETIPETGGNQGESDKGDIRTDVEKGENTPETSISTPVKELADIILTEAEKQQAENGTNIKIVLDVKDASDSISSQDKAAAESALDGFTAGQYLDISLYKIIGEKRSAVSETNKKIAITIAVPDSLKNADSNITRNFAIIRVHNNQAEILNDLDNSDNTITIETDRFSAYSIIYKDTAKAGTNDTKGGNGSTENGSTAKQAPVPKTGDSNSLELYATLAMIAGLAWLLSIGKKTIVE